MKTTILILSALLTMSLPAMANLHVWDQKQFQAYSDKTEVKFTLINKYNKKADYYLRIDNKPFPNKLSLGPNQDIELNINVKTPAGQKTKKKYVREWSLIHLIAMKCAPTLNSKGIDDEANFLIDFDVICPRIGER